MWYPQIQAMLGKLYVISLYFTLYAAYLLFFLPEDPVMGFCVSNYDAGTTAWISVMSHP
jgi:hypothetical protein